MRRATTAHARRRGFTIVELVVALTLSGIVALAAIGAMGVATDASARLRADRRLATSGLTARAQLAGWLRSATLLQGTEPFVGTRRAGAESRLDELTFAVADGGALHPGPRRLRLLVDRDPATPVDGLVAELSPLRGASTRTDTVEIAPGVVGLALRYRAGAPARTGWVERWSSTRELPAAVELRLRPATTDATAKGSALLGVPLVTPVGWGSP